MNQQWQQLQQMRQSDRLPHALLFKGAPRTGKQALARYFTQALLCLNSNADGTPCDKCHGCRQVLAQSHPDVHEVMPHKEGHAIKVDQIRDLNEFVRQSSLQGGYRVALICPADAMNVNAANALLKTLEEPASGAILILVSNQSGQLPATILSRCQFVRFSGISTTIDEETLSLRQQIQNELISAQPDPLKLADLLQKNEPLTVIDCYIGWLTDLLSKTNQPHLVTLIDYAQQIRKHLSNGINLNKQLMLEDLFIRWTQYANMSR